MLQETMKADWDKLEQAALESAQRIFPCEKDLLNHIPIADIIKEKCASNIAQATPYLIRVAGQSGSGKSTQLIPALENVLKGQNYVKINVGAFAPFHPKYQEWQQKDPALVREKTNGFALRALLLFYRYCVEHNVNILFDMTLLEPEIEHYLMGFAKQNGYQIQLHVLCVPKKVSNLFIRKRYAQTGRYVSTYSTDYFFNALAPALKSLVNQRFFDKTDSVFMWTHYHSRPIKKTSFFNPYITTILMKNRRNRRIKRANALLKAKITYLNLFKRKV